MRKPLAMIFPLLCGMAPAEDKPAKVTAEWISESTACQPGKPLQTAVRLIHIPGWHSYWINPGEAGMKTIADWKLPPGWKTDGLRFPIPGRFLSSTLVGFGYEGTVLLPVTVTPPPDHKGTARLTATVKWLSCSEEGCVPGKADIHLDVFIGESAPTRDSAEIKASYRNVPRPADDSFRLSVTDRADKLALAIEAVGASTIDLDGREVLAATQDVIDARAPIQFVKIGRVWTAEVPKSEYAPNPVKSLTLAIAGDRNGEALQLTWNAP